MMNSMDNFCSYCFCYLVLICVSTITGESIQECLQETLPEKYIEWSDSKANVATMVEWEQAKRICTSLNQCFHQDYSEDIKLDPQIYPRQIQKGTPVIFKASSDMDVSFTIKTYSVSEIAFEKCVKDENRQVNMVFTDQPFLVNDAFLSVGSNYFIAATDDKLFKCSLGLRINITVKENDCGVNAKCSFKGRCVTSYDRSQFMCKCCHGFTGTTCEKLSSCRNDPCQNGGKCIEDSDDPENKYNCQCPLAYSGYNCEYHYDNLCSAEPCEHDSTCIGDTDTFLCDCLPGYEGRQCEIDINECQSSPCIHGVCSDNVNGFKCYCEPGYSGIHCDKYVSLCASNPCRNGGDCMNIKDGWQCKCTSGYHGKDCSEKVDLCSPNPCFNSIECIDYGNYIGCTCRPGFIGFHCEININECSSSPCLHGGICHDLKAAYRCQCRIGTDGMNCEKKVEVLIPRNPEMLDYLENRQNYERDAREIHNLKIAIAVLSVALSIALLILLLCYCRKHGYYTKLKMIQQGYTRHENIESPRRTDSAQNEKFVDARPIESISARSNSAYQRMKYDSSLEQAKII